MQPQTQVSIVFSMRHTDKGDRWGWELDREPPADLVSVGEMPGFTFWTPVDDLESAGFRDALEGFKKNHAPLICLDKRVLIVDDEVGVRGIFKLILTRYGFLIEGASGGEPGLAVLESQDFDVVIVDDVMPGMDGIEVTRRIRSNPRWDGLPVVMCGIYAYPEFLAKAQAAGIDAHMAKPLQSSEFLSTITRLARSGRKPPGEDFTLGLPQA